jgi:hypothetical protein
MLAGILAPLASSGSFQLQDPRLLTFEQWARTTLIDADYPVEVWLPWQDWAATQILKGVFNPGVPPDPRLFIDWREWVLRIKDLE